MMTIQQKSLIFLSGLVACLFGLVACYGGYGGGGHSLAIQTKGHSVQSFYSGGDNGNGKTTQVTVGGGVAPIKMHFASKSSPIYMSQSHYNSGGSYSSSSSYDKPHVKSHVVYKPVISNLKEVIMPYQNHHQIIKPVMKSFHTSYHGGHY